MKIYDELLNPIPVKCYRCGKDIGNIKDGVIVTVQSNSEYPDFTMRMIVNGSFILCRKCAEDIPIWAKENK